MPAFIILLALVMASSCSSQPQEAPMADISWSPDTLRFEQAGGAQTLSVTASDAVQILCQDSWISNIEPPYLSEGRGDVEIKASSNSKTTARSTDITIKCGDVRAYVPVIQPGREPDPASDSVSCPDGYSLVWQDEFDDDKVSTTNWRFEDWAKGYVNNELQRYVAGGELDGHKTAFVADGALNIVAMKYGSEVISARMNTRRSWKYGWFEARIWLPKGKGTWPAFWCMPDDQSLGWPACGEIDIMEEVGVDANYTSSSIHTKSYNHTKNTQKTASRYTRGAEDGYHVYALEWTADYIQTYVDGVKLLRFDNDGKSNNDTWPFAKNFYITLNLAWGGDWGGYAGVDASALPCTMKVDYVRVFQVEK